MEEAVAQCELAVEQLQIPEANAVGLRDAPKGTSQFRDEDLIYGVSRVSEPLLTEAQRFMCFSAGDSTCGNPEIPSSSPWCRLQR